ncbi:ATP synthase subunit g, mitochondrial [Hydra vulgaris]|uniref:ATP synthase subunit g, mitochondrial n=1 Tax=Hydra vulgaris TaxID=6087 RepID=A0ABM4B4Y7_HYDVU
MAQKAIQMVQSASPEILIRVGKRGVNAVTKFGRVMQPRLNNFAKNASVECAPPTPSEFFQQLTVLRNDLISGKSFQRLKDMSVNEATAKGLVLLECAFWGVIGEMIGRRSIVGYNPTL